MNPKVNGQVQQEWGWLLAVYLFLGGVGGGAYTIAAINSFLGKSMELSTIVGLWIGFPALAIGSVFLLLDLGSPSKFVLAGMKPGTSWIARGFWIILAFMGASFFHLVLYNYTSMGQTADGMHPVLMLLSVVGIVTAVLTMAYTGILLSASKGIPFWRSGVVPAVFVISAVVTGHFSIMLGMVLFNEGAASLPGMQIMALEAAVLVVVEVLAIFFFLQAAFREPDSRESAQRILRRRAFVYGYFILGLGAPLVLMLAIYLFLVDGTPALNFAVAAVGALLGLLGGLILRQSVLVCGTLPTLNVGGFEFRRIPRAKTTRPQVGMMPPQ